MDGKLRIVQLVEQFEVLKNPDDPELLIKFGTGRMAQILPKIDHMLATGKQYTGFGFLHEDLTTNNEFVIINELYSDVTQSEETVARVEVTQIQTILDAGLIGLLIQTIYYLAIYFLGASPHAIQPVLLGCPTLHLVLRHRWIYGTHLAPRPLAVGSYNRDHTSLPQTAIRKFSRQSPNRLVYQPNNVLPKLWDLPYLHNNSLP